MSCAVLEVIGLRFQEKTGCSQHTKIDQFYASVKNTGLSMSGRAAVSFLAPAEEVAWKRIGV